MASARCFIKLLNVFIWAVEPLGGAIARQP
jgi:hypothetical protein